MSDELINPNGYETGHVKELGARFAGGKVYYAKLGGANLPFLVGTVQPSGQARRMLSPRRGRRVWWRSMTRRCWRWWQRQARSQSQLGRRDER